MRVLRISFAAFTIAATLGVTACAPSNPVATPTDDGTGAFGSVDPTASTPPPPATTTQAPPTYPATAKAYAEAVLAAWKDKQTATLGDLTTPMVQEQILEIPGPPPQDWTHVRCDGAAGSSYCVFFNSDGDEITLRISNQLLGQAHAATQVTLDVPEYPSDGIEYVKEFVAAWKNSNKPRMLLLSKPSVVNLLGTAPAANPTYPAPVCCGGGLLQVVANFGGNTMTFDVGTTLLGMPHAIIGYAP
jgi:hypothetical protein